MISCELFEQIKIIDYYLIQNLGQNRTSMFDKFELWKFVFEMKEKARSHGKPVIIMESVKGGLWADPRSIS